MRPGVDCVQWTGLEWSGLLTGLFCELKLTVDWNGLWTGLWTAVDWSGPRTGVDHIHVLEWTVDHSVSWTKEVVHVVHVVQENSFDRFVDLLFGFVSFDRAPLFTYISTPSKLKNILFIITQILTLLFTIQFSICVIQANYNLCNSLWMTPILVLLFTI